MFSRRNFLIDGTLFSIGSAYTNLPTLFSFDSSMGPAVQQYTWYSYLQREGITWNKDLDAFINKMKGAGFNVFEPAFNTPEEATRLMKAFDVQNVSTHSLYVNSTLHEPDKVEDSISGALAIARVAKQAGCRIVVTNPSPIQWGNPIDKTDEQLAFQAKHLDKLGKELRKLGMKLAYHTHDMEMRQSAREFHHMLLNTDPENVHLCLDSHWVFRGAGDSQVALFDIVKLYGHRIAELHLRQSNKGVWSEVFGEGDIDHEKLVGMISDLKIKPHIVLEQAVEDGTPQTMSAVQAITKGFDYMKEICAPLL